MDTGATMNVIGTHWADLLGLEWFSAPRTPLFGIAGSIEGFVLPVEMRLIDADYSWTADVAFCPNLETPIPLLGIQGFFDRFEVRFRAATSYYRIHLR